MAVIHRKAACLKPPLNLIASWLKHTVQCTKIVYCTLRASLKRSGTPARQHALVARLKCWIGKLFIARLSIIFPNKPNHMLTFSLHVNHSDQFDRLMSL